MYKIKLSKVYSLNSCRTEYQIGDSYCPWSKIACSALETRKITSSPCYLTAGIGELYPAPARFFKQVIACTSREAFDNVIAINDDMSGKFGENHERALKLAIQLVVQSNLVEIEDEDGELIAELRRRIEAFGTDWICDQE